MFRKLTENDRELVIDYVLQELAYNVFTFGDMENFGFNTPFQTVWGDFDDEGNVRAVLLRYYNHYIISSMSGKFDLQQVGRFLEKVEDKWYMSGKEVIVTALGPVLGLSRYRRQYLAELQNLEYKKPQSPSPRVEWATLDTIHQVIELQRTIEEFKDTGDSADSLDSFLHNLRSGTGRTVYISINGKPVSSASSAAKNSRSAMIIGVCTDKEHRSKGYASLCMEQLCRVLLEENKLVCLFYDNPAAGRIYKNLGFRDVGRWTMAFR